MRGNKMVVARLAPIHYCDVPLSKHRGHGGAKGRH